MIDKKQFTLFLVLLISASTIVNAQRRQVASDIVNTKQSPSRTEVITPIHKNEFRKVDYKLGNGK